jgi:hypothetical protein
MKPNMASYPGDPTTRPNQALVPNGGIASLLQSARLVAAVAELWSGPTRMKRPSLEASESEILAFARDWVRFAAKRGLDEALRLIDKRDSDPAWSEAILRSISEDHFSDGETCVITDPEAFKELRVDAYRYNDGSGFAVDHDLAMNHKRSDFTAQFEFRKMKEGYAIYLADIHVL